MFYAFHVVHKNRFGN